eukprot:2064750-Pyramimonas_sp.AAC.1
MRTSTWAGGCSALSCAAVAVLSCRMIFTEAICGNFTLPATKAVSKWSASSKPLSLKTSAKWRASWRRASGILRAFSSQSCFKCYT